jgi:serine protease Do
LAKKPWPAAETQVISADGAEALEMKGTKGVRLSRIFPDRAADKAGLKVGDLITHLDGESIDASRPEDSEVYAAMLRRYRIGTEGDLKVGRDGNSLTITMKLEAPPEDSARLTPYEDTDFEFTVRDIAFSDRDDDEAKDDEDAGGVLVTGVERGGWANLAGLGSGDRLLEFNGVAIKNIKHLRTLLDAVKKERPRRISAFLKRRIMTRFIEFEPDWK